MNDWQPIETAPKDGTIFLAFCPDQPPFYRGDWHYHKESPAGVVLLFWDDCDGYVDRQQGLIPGWCIPAYSRHGVGRAHNPTHWMPLPEGP